MGKISRRNFSKTLTAGVGGAVINPLAGLTVKEAQKTGIKKRPNIVFICSDQHSYKYTGYAGHNIVKTPNLDRIASQGVVFSDTYTGNPVSVPGRTSMMTGMLASDCNSFCNSTVYDGSHPVWGTYLKNAGYYCRATGKMDLNKDFETGFDEVDTSHGHCTDPDITSLFRRPIAYRSNERDNADGRMRQERHGDAAKTEKGLKFLKEETPGIKKPWALFLGLTEPHPKFVALEQYYNMYPEYNMDMPNIPPGHLEDLHLVFQELRHFKRIATPIPEDRIRRARAGYYGMISELDEYIGKMYDALEQSGELENTLFIYTSDHGESLGEHGLWLKNNLYDVAARVPLVMAGAGLPKNVKISTPVAHIDVVATMLDLAGSDAYNKLRGHTLLPLLKGKEGSQPEFAFSESHSEGNCTGSFLIRKGDWKYIHFSWYDDLLFNVAEDPGEFNNLIDKPETAAVQAELKNILYSLVDPEEVTMRAFEAQDKVLAGFTEKMTEDQLFNLLKGRLGPGQARTLAKKYKS
jgi:choline-sulfatase